MLNGELPTAVQQKSKCDELCQTNSGDLHIAQISDRLCQV